MMQTNLLLGLLFLPHLTIVDLKFLVVSFTASVLTLLTESEDRIYQTLMSVSSGYPNAKKRVEKYDTQWCLVSWGNSLECLIYWYLLKKNQDLCWDLLSKLPSWMWFSLFSFDKVLISLRRENLKLRTCCIDWAIARSILQGTGLKFSHKDQTFEVK